MQTNTTTTLNHNNDNSLPDWWTRTPAYSSGSKKMLRFILKKTHMKLNLSTNNKNKHHENSFKK